MESWLTRYTTMVVHVAKVRAQAVTFGLILLMEKMKQITKVLNNPTMGIYACNMLFHLFIVQ